MVYVHPAYYSHHFENQLISWAAALYGSTALLTVATNFTKSFFRQAGFVELAEVCREGTRLALDTTDFVADLMLYRPPGSGPLERKPIAMEKQRGQSRSRDGLEAQTAGPPGDDDLETTHSAVAKRGRGGRKPGSKNKPKKSPPPRQPETPPPDERDAAEEQKSPSARFYKRG